MNPEHAALKDEKTLHLLKDIIAAVPVQYIYLHHSFLADKTAQEMLIMVSFKRRGRFFSSGNDISLCPFFGN